MNLRWMSGMISVGALCWGTIFGAALASGQFAGPAVSGSTAGTSSPVSALKARYDAVKIMPGDVISITTYGAPELTTSTTTSTDAPGNTSGASSSVNGIKVGAQGEIVLPYLGVVKVAGMTPSDAAAYLEQELKD